MPKHQTSKVAQTHDESRISRLFAAASLAGEGHVDEILAWDEITRRGECQGRWVALDHCSYDSDGHATAGAVVDTDTSLADLCARLRADERTHCDVLFCPEGDLVA